MAIKVGKRRFKSKEEAIYYTVGLKKLTVQQAATFVDELERRRKERELEKENLKRIADIEKEKKLREREQQKLSLRGLQAIEEKHRKDEEKAQRFLSEVTEQQRKREAEIADQKRIMDEKQERQRVIDEQKRLAFIAQMKEKRADTGIAKEPTKKPKRGRGGRPSVLDLIFGYYPGVYYPIVYFPMEYGL